MELIFKRILLSFRRHIEHLTWPLIMTSLAAHMAATWVLLWLLGEKELLAFSHYVYYYIVTTSTVGYGDMSPSSELGRIAVALFQIPFGLALFGVFLGKTGQTITNIIKQAMTGERDLSSRSDHIIIFGWHATRTAKMIKYILADNKRLGRKIILAVSEEMTHPFPENPHVDFAKLSSFTDNNELARVAIDKADKVIIYGRDDNQTFTSALKISKLVKAQCHISAYFIDESKSEMLREHCANVECCSSKAAEILVRSMQDPGSSRIQEELLSTLYGDTQFSIVVGDVSKDLAFEKLFFHFKKHCNATVLGIAHCRTGDKLDLNPPLDYPVNQGDVIHYIAPERLLADEVNWQAI